MFDLEMTVPNLIGLLMILGTPNGIVISLDVEKYLKELINRLYRNESHAQLFDNVSHLYFPASYQIYFYGPQ